MNLFSFGCHVTDRAYVRTYASTDCTGRVGETIKRKGGVSQACLGKSSSFMYDSHNMVNLFSFRYHVTDRAYVRTYASTDCTGRVGETIKRKEGVSQACLAKSSSFIYDTHNMVN